MASSGQGQAPIPIPQQTQDAMDDYNEELEDDVEMWINTASYIPKDIDYDWRPFCRALIENHRIAKYLFPDPPPPPPSNNTRRGGPRDVVKGIQQEPRGLAPEPGKQFRHVRYIPAWMDPDYTQDTLVTPAGRQLQNSVRDAMYNLRPALRLSDEIRRPTDYAQRFGIAADRLDGRSRMSPTWSGTRNPLEYDFFNQIDQLSEENRQLAEKLSLDKWKAMNKKPPPGQEILPEVMEQLLEQHGMMTNAGLAAEIEKEAKRGRSLDEMVDDLKSANPEAFKAHKGFLESLKDDQDYQRIVLMGLTTDEMVQNNIHTISDDVEMDLDNPIHPLFDRDRWDDGWWRGRVARTPRNVYNINGTREEYNAATNDVIWEALQPALRLVSMVLANKPPHLEAIMNMNTRQPIPLAEGELEERFPPNMTRYVLEEDIDMDKTYPAIRRLHEVYNYDWKANVLRVLEHTFVLDIESAYTLGHPYVINETNSNDPHKDFWFGSCATHKRFAPPPEVVGGDDSMIIIKLAADVIWPLLVPQYSKSEKLATSFVIASTLLHEFAVCFVLSHDPGIARELENRDTETHAAAQAQELLTKRHWAELPGQHPEVAELLMSLDGVVWDVHFGAHQEPFFYDCGVEELGHDFEHSLWGHATNLTGDGEGMSRHHQSLVFAIGEYTHPPDTGNGPREDAPFPMMHYMRPVPIDYMAKFFSKRFWKEEFGAYGFGALRMMPDNRIRKNLSYEPIVPSKNFDIKLYGGDRGKFLAAVPMILITSRQYVLGTYLNALRMEIAYQEQFDKWWVDEVDNWEEELLHPLQGSVDLLNVEFERIRDLNLWHRAAVPDKVSYYGHYRNTMNPNDPNILSYAEWQENVIEQWNKETEYGGWLMQKLLIVHNHMQTDIGNLQRMAFYFLATKSPNTKIMFRDSADELTIPGLLLARLEEFRFNSRRIAGMLNYLANLEYLSATQDAWEQWEARFKANGDQYNRLMMLLAEGAKEDSEPFDVYWKAQFDRLATGSWKHVSEVYKKMALREYARADPAVRKTVDDFLSTYTKLNLMDTAQVNTKVGAIGQALKSMNGIARRTTTRNTNSIFDFFARPRSGRGPPPPLVLPPQPSPSSLLPTPSPTSGHIFGVPGGPKMMETAGDPRPRRVLRVQKSRSNAQKSAAYRNYVTNMLKTPDLGLVSAAAANLFKPSVPQPILDLLPSQKQLGPGSARPPIKPFPNPYAGRNVMTSVNTQFQERKELAQKSRRVVDRAGGTYVAPSLWREAASDEGSSDGESQEDVNMSDA
ncbi:hypothetical protein F4803DRAFT_575044 [Xylaria telfairii]|nr:hypothetical protein F4803DRAFT_575044 [Xylaria telfairii]